MESASKLFFFGGGGWRLAGHWKSAGSFKDPPPQRDQHGEASRRLL